MAGKFSLAAHIQKSEPSQVRDIEAITSEILDAKRAGGEAILTIGRGLMEAKALLSHGEWLPWLEEQVEFSERAAQRFMRLARDYSNPTLVSDLGMSKALVLLALPEEKREEFVAVPHVVNGVEKSVSDMTRQELEAAIKERDEALKAAELAKADQSAAEQAREKLSQDVKFANERITGLSSEINALKSNAKIAKETADKELKEARQAAILHQKSFEESEKEVARLEQELETLRSQPREVAVEVDEAAVEAARKEAEERMQAQLDAAKKEQEKVRADLSKTNNALQRAKQAQADALIELEKMREQAKNAEKKSAITTDPDLVLFSELLDQAQTLVKRMGGVRLKKKAKDPDTAEKLQAAMMALSTAAKEAACQ